MIDQDWEKRVEAERLRKEAMEKPKRKDPDQLPEAVRKRREKGDVNKRAGRLTGRKALYKTGPPQLPLDKMADVRNLIMNDFEEERLTQERNAKKLAARTATSSITGASAARSMWCAWSARTAACSTSRARAEPSVASAS